MAKLRQTELRRIAFAAVALMGLVGVARVDASLSAYTVSNLGLVGSDPASTGPGINNSFNVEVVGQSAAGSSPAAGYSISGGTLTPFATSSGADGAANAVNDGGVAVGFYTVGSNQLAFHSNAPATTLTSLPTFGGSTNVATAVNGGSSTCSIVGQSEYTSGALRAFSWSSSSPSTINYLGPTSDDDGLGATGVGAASQANGINASGLIVGYAQTPTAGQHAFIYKPDPTHPKMYDLGVGTTDGSGNSVANAINSSGEIVGTTDTGTSGPDDPYRAFVYTGLNFSSTAGSSTDTTLTAGTLHVLGSLDGTGDSSAAAINDNGVVVGSSSAGDGSVMHAFLQDFNGGGTMQDLNSADLILSALQWRTCVDTRRTAMYLKKPAAAGGHPRPLWEGRERKVKTNSVEIPGKQAPFQTTQIGRFDKI
jgi:probable HAF family extracellular repeat protein